MKLELWAVEEFYCRGNGSDMGGTETGEYFKDHNTAYKYIQEKYGVEDPDNIYSSYFLYKKTLNIIDG